MALAMERGEVQGIGSWNYSSLAASKPEWLRDKTITLLLQLGLTRHPGMPEVPTVLDLAKTDEQKELLRLVFAQQSLGRPVIGPPDMPKDLVVMLQKAFSDIIADPNFLGEAKRRGVEINNPMGGAEASEFVARIHAVEADLIQRASAAMGSDEAGASK
jgi:hypothetical protein